MRRKRAAKKGEGQKIGSAIKALRPLFRELDEAKKAAAKLPLRQLAIYSELNPTMRQDFEDVMAERFKRKRWINRAAIVVRPGRPYIEWASRLDDEAPEHAKLPHSIPGQRLGTPLPLLEVGVIDLSGIPCYQ